MEEESNRDVFTVDGDFEPKTLSLNMYEMVSLRLQL